ncbi:dephospho-CoA kinase domain-containing protein isoform X1 [Mobula hypostoma]|uniref:dephospho-CoA kinase domain-containing protein isoform X1 n=1 Tax=Mobula hypostoma TaxID=723540 RepID=UPI002FC343DC
MFLVGLTGGIASGKSTVAALFHELGCPVIDSDQIARQVVELDSPVYWAIVRSFGEEILLEDRTINREKLGSIIFSNRQKRLLLNSITHPAIHKALLKQVFIYFIQGYRYVILDVPLLFETNKMAKFMKHTIVVYCDPQAQLTRLMKRNNLIQAEAERRISVQMPLEQKCKLATHVIDNSGDPASTYRQGPQHIREAKRREGCSSISQFFSAENQSLTEKVTRAEVYFTSFIAEHNLPFQVCKHTGKLFRKMFPDSDIAKNYACSSTKTAAIVKVAH